MKTLKNKNSISQPNPEQNPSRRQPGTQADSNEGVMAHIYIFII